MRGTVVLSRHYDVKGERTRRLEWVFERLCLE